ncbi:MAG TPA: methyltransferase domain-containing protein [Vicinamibacterales bacterium]
MADAGIDAWLLALEARHLANLTRPELTRALRALSSCYVERRDKLKSGAALDGAGKRAAFALFYGPLHFLTIQRVLRALDWEGRALPAIHDLGCGTGVGGAAWAAAAGGAVRVAGVDRNAWAVAEANWTYRQFALRGSSRTGDLVRDFPRDPNAGIVLAYAVNELPDEARAALLERIVSAPQSPLLVVEPIARQDRAWWQPWATRLAGAGVREDEWRFPAELPRLLRDIAKGAGLDPRELTARTLSR